MGNQVKRLAVLGSTGSIGQQTLDIVRTFPQHFQVIGLAAGANARLLAEQVQEFRPRFVFCQDRTITLPHLSEFLPMTDMACHPDVDMVVMATSGKAGLAPTLSAARAGKKIALANKESLVMAGGMVTREVRRHGARILPVDSEHSAVWQCLRGERQKPAKIILTASGGPFLHYSPEQLKAVTAAQALKHPSWHMGRKVTIDSATLMNKGLEVIEAHWLFNVPFANIKVVIHPQSIAHSMVEFTDGAVKAQLSYPDMRLPIQYALSYPQRLPNPELPHVDWGISSSLTFAPPEPDRFPCLRLAIEAGQKGGTYPTALCAADEIAVELFLAGQIGFADIAGLVAAALDEHQPVARPDLGDILAADTWARERVQQLVAKGL
ncbi:MAG: 1-deoxy-D-xylulose-5-phosphate reductoisomerase [Chloroflexi bacterium]|nr:1-deoxy-D-xylulose-5-phosphate reductoisomerase [Chloroflexota bacterium]